MKQVGLEGPTIVLILILMEYVRRHLYKQYCKKNTKAVLILILMEYVRRHEASWSRRTNDCGLNPYSNGICPKTESKGYVYEASWSS